MTAPLSSQKKRQVFHTVRYSGRTQSRTSRLDEPHRNIMLFALREANQLLKCFDGIINAT